MFKDFFRKNCPWEVIAAIAVVLLSLWLAKIIGISDEILQLLQTPYVLLFIFVLVFREQFGELIGRIKTLFGVRFHKQVSVQPMAKTLREFIEKISASGQTAANKGESGAKPEAGKTTLGSGFIAEIQKKAKEGDAEAQLMLGVRYANGKGIARDDEEAVKWYRQSAEQGDVLAQLMLGMCYGNGEGVAQDKAEAVKWFRLAAEQGLAIAQLMLGVRYANGKGIARDDAEAVKWYRRAAEQGLAVAQNNLGIAYHNGNGVPQSPWEAYVWHSIAAANGIEESEKFRDEDARLLSAEDLARAQSEAVRRAEDIRKQTEKKK